MRCPAGANRQGGAGESTWEIPAPARELGEACRLAGLPPSSMGKLMRNGLNELRGDFIGTRVLQTVDHAPIPNTKTAMAAHAAMQMKLFLSQF